LRVGFWWLVPQTDPSGFTMISTESKLGFKTLIWEQFIQSHSQALLRTVTIKSDKVMCKVTK
jgi:hypothetical protein